jgi:hypothetical protein
MGKVEEAHQDALVTIQLDPNYANGVGATCFIELKRGNGKRAQAAYQRAIEIAGLADSQLKSMPIQSDRRKKTDPSARGDLWKSFHDRDWDILGKIPELHSHVHQRQVDGLLVLAERMKRS